MNIPYTVEERPDTGLANGKHTVRLVTRADADPRSKGKAVRIDWAVVYGPGKP